MSLEGLERLDVWRKAKGFAVKVYSEGLLHLPPEEKWGMGQQLRRAVQSISANIAEGHGRYYYQENVRFCYIVRGSLEETISLLALAYELDYLPEGLFKSFVEESEDLSKLINGYIAYLKRTKQGAQEPGADRNIHEKTAYYDEFPTANETHLEIDD